MKKSTLLIAFFLLTGITYGQTAQWARTTGGPDQLDTGSDILADAKLPKNVCRKIEILD